MHHKHSIHCLKAQDFSLFVTIVLTVARNLQVATFSAQIFRTDHNGHCQHMLIRLFRLFHKTVYFILSTLIASMTTSLFIHSQCHRNPSVIFLHICARSHQRFTEHIFFASRSCFHFNRYKLIIRIGYRTRDSVPQHVDAWIRHIFIGTMHLFIARHLVPLFKLENITQKHFPKVSTYCTGFIRKKFVSYNGNSIPIFIFTVLSQFIITHIMPPHVNSPVSYYRHTNFITIANSVTGNFSHFIIYHSYNWMHYR